MRAECFIHLVHPHCTTVRC